MLHLKNSSYVPKNASNLLKKARQFCSGMNAIIRDSRVSSKFIEFDISIKKNALEDLVEKLQPIGVLDHAKHIVEEKIDKEQAITNGIFYFNNERFWECHEVFEGVWKNCYGSEKNLLHGIILVAAAFVHYQKDQDSICLSVFGRALKKLANLSGNYHNIDVDRIKNKVIDMKNSGQISTFEI